MSQNERRQLYQELRVGEEEWASSIEPTDDKVADPLLAANVLTALEKNTTLKVQTPLRSSARPMIARRWMLAASLAAVGAAGSLFYLFYDSSESSKIALVPRTLELRGERQEMGARTQAGKVARIGRDSRLTITLRPETDMHDSADAAQAYVQAEPDGLLRRWDIPLEPKPSGAFFLSKPVIELPPLSPGSYELFLTYGMARRLPDGAELLRVIKRGGPARGAGWGVQSGRLIIEAR